VKRWAPRGGLAAKNKCLAERNKPRTGNKATNSASAPQHLPVTLVSADRGRALRHLALAALDRLGMMRKGQIKWEIAVPTIMAALPCYYFAGPIGFIVAMAAGTVWHAVAEESAKTSAQLDALRDQLEAIREVTVSNASTLSMIETRVDGTRDTIADQFHMEELARLTPEQRARIDELLGDDAELRAYLEQLEREGAFER
jgi:hypothetical protein